MTILEIGDVCKYQTNMKTTNLTPVVSGNSIQNVQIGDTIYQTLNGALAGIDASTDRKELWNSGFVTPAELPRESQLYRQTDGLQEKTPYEIIKLMFSKKI